MGFLKHYPWGSGHPDSQYCHTALSLDHLDHLRLWLPPWWLSAPRTHTLSSASSHCCWNRWNTPRLEKQVEANGMSALGEFYFTNSSISHENTCCVDVSWAVILNRVNFLCLLSVSSLSSLLNFICQAAHSKQKASQRRERFFCLLIDSWKHYETKGRNLCVCVLSRSVVSNSLWLHGL